MTFRGSLYQLSDFKPKSYLLIHTSFCCMYVEREEKKNLSRTISVPSSDYYIHGGAIVCLCALDIREITHVEKQFFRNDTTQEVTIFASFCSIVVVENHIHNSCRLYVQRASSSSLHMFPPYYRLCFCATFAWFLRPVVVPFENVAFCNRPQHMP